MNADRSEASEVLRVQVEEVQSLNVALELTLDGEGGQQFTWINPTWYDVIGYMMRLVTCLIARTETQMFTFRIERTLIRFLGHLSRIIWLLLMPTCSERLRANYKKMICICWKFNSVSRLNPRRRRDCATGERCKRQSMVSRNGGQRHAYV
jgi:hypothetical protein